MVQTLVTFPLLPSMVKSQSSNMLGMLGSSPATIPAALDPLDPLGVGLRPAFSMASKASVSWSWPSHLLWAWPSLLEFQRRTIESHVNSKMIIACFHWNKPMSSSTHQRYIKTPFVMFSSSCYPAWWLDAIPQGFATVVHHLSGWCLPHPGFLCGHHGAGVSSSRDATVVKTLYTLGIGDAAILCNFNFDRKTCSLLLTRWCANNCQHVYT